ncbi:MAG TPA: superoxide dismutase family protein [Bacillaceae bacterium]|nr:superoxide dismutase family protein [Bacillaceae bacterium]
MKKMLFSIAIVLFTILLGVGNADNILITSAASTNTPAPIEIDLINGDEEKIGTATFTESSKGVKIRVKAEGLEPGTKAIHIHETGKCVAPDFTSAGGHFNPGKKEHGFENPKGFHAGDLPNIEVSAQGVVDVEIVAPGLTLKQGAENSLLDADGSALVIHEKADDYKTNPAGNAGDRIVCGVIGKE